jgi:quercetin dioxygenase-like cupin family protein
VSGGVTVVPLEAVEPIPLPKDSWSRMVLTGSTAGAGSSMGYSVFKPGMVTAMVSHEVEELAFVVAGQGELRLDDGRVAFGPGQALHIPAGTWHAVAVTGDEEVVMVFAFPHPDYPPTQRR